MVTRTDLHHTADDHRQHVERKAQDVEERQRNKGLLGIKHIFVIDQHVHRESGQGNLPNEKEMSGDRKRVAVANLVFYFDSICCIFFISSLFISNL